MSRSARLRKLDDAESPIVTPSILSCDFGSIAEVFAQLEAAGAIAAHLDVMDGHFVPNLTYGPPVIKDWRKHTSLPFDAHLMIDNPESSVEDYIAAGCDEVIFHIEVLPNPVELLRHIRAAGCRAGLALNPSTPLESLTRYLDELDKVLVMSVMPGFGGQSFDPGTHQRLRSLRALRPDLAIAVDGGIKAENAAAVVADGATQLVIGSGIFRHDASVSQALAQVNTEIRGWGRASD